MNTPRRASPIGSGLANVWDCATHARTRGGFTRARTLASRAWHRASTPRVMSGAPPEPPGEGAETPGDDVEMSRLLALDVTPISELAAVAAARGFRDASTRARAWPKLLALDVTRADAAAALFEGRASALNARERNQVELDVRRSHWIPASAGAEARARLSRVIRGVLATRPGECRYYQGLHDVAAVLLLVCDEAAPAALDRLVVGHLRDAVRGGGLDSVLETLRLLPHLIAVADPELHAAVFPASTRSAFAASERSPGPKMGASTAGALSDGAPGVAASDGSATDASSLGTETGEAFRSRPTANGRDGRVRSRPPSGSGSDSDDSFELLSVADFSEMEHVGTCHFAVSWLLTWFAHSLHDLDDVSRLFDTFLASDPLMPLYVGAAAVVADRDTLLAMARGEMDETGAFVVEAETEAAASKRGEKKKRRAMNRAEDWPLIEGMLHARLSALPALAGTRTRASSANARVDDVSSDEERLRARDVVRLRWKVVETAGADGGFRSAVAARLFVESRGEEGRGARPENPKRRPGWGVEAVLRSAAALHARLPPRALYTVLGTEPDPFSAFAAYPYPWLAANRRGFGGSSSPAAGAETARREANDVASSERGRETESGRYTIRLGEGASATALFAQRLGANIRRAARRGVNELKKMERAEPARGWRGFLGGIRPGGTADASDAVPRLND